MGLSARWANNCSTSTIQKLQQHLRTLSSYQLPGWYAFNGNMSTENYIKVNNRSSKSNEWNQFKVSNKNSWNRSSETLTMSCFLTWSQFHKMFQSHRWLSMLQDLNRKVYRLSWKTGKVSSLHYLTFLRKIKIVLQNNSENNYFARNTRRKSAFLQISGNRLSLDIKSLLIGKWQNWGLLINASINIYFERKLSVAKKREKI